MIIHANVSTHINTLNMKKIFLLLILFRCTVTLSQTFIISSDNVIVNHDTSSFFSQCGDSFSIDVNDDDQIDFLIEYTFAQPHNVVTANVYTDLPNTLKY
jgi:hypothetical protein